MDLDKTLAWKQSLVFVGGIIVVLSGWAITALIFWLGILMELIGFGLLLWNIISVKKANQENIVKTALIVPKIVIFILLVLVTLFVIFTSVLLS